MFWAGSETFPDTEIELRNHNFNNCLTILLFLVNKNITIEGSKLQVLTLFFENIYNHICKEPYGAERRHEHWEDNTLQGRAVVMRG